MSWGARAVPAQQFETWEAVYGPVGDDGYPKPMCDKATGKIDHKSPITCATTASTSPTTRKPTGARSGPKLKGKIHVYCGDMD